MVWGYLGLNDRVKVSKRGARKDVGKVVKIHMESNHADVRYDDGTEVTVRIGDAQKTRERKIKR